MLFTRKIRNGTSLLILDVDDMIITWDDVDDVDGIRNLKTFLHSQFEMKDPSSLSYCLGLEVNSDSTGVHLSQTRYAFDLVAKV